MKRKFLRQLWLAVRIWLVALAANTLLGTLYLAGVNLYNAGFLMVFGALYGGLFSFPIMMAILLIINRCAAAEKNGLLLFRIVFIVGIALTVVVFLTFWNMVMGRGDSGMQMLLCIAILSGIVGITTFYKSLLKWGREFTNPQNYEL